MSKEEQLAYIRGMSHMLVMVSTMLQSNLTQEQMLISAFDEGIRNLFIKENMFIMTEAKNDY